MVPSRNKHSFFLYYLATYCHLYPTRSDCGLTGYTVCHPLASLFHDRLYMLFMLEIAFVLFFKVLHIWEFVDVYYEKEECKFLCCGWKINKLEVAIFVFAVTLPLLFEWIPFTTNSYGPLGTWCWIRNLEENCNLSSAGMLEQVWLWDVPFVTVAFLTSVLFSVTVPAGMWY